MKSRVISHYKITRRLGQGGMAEVYAAVDTDTQQRVALKFLLSPHASEPTARKRFLREAKAGMKLDHPGIVKVFDIGESDGQPFIAMELVRGKTLSEILEKRSLSVSRTIDIGLQVAEALAVAHNQGIVHRDINPRNIMICGDTVKVMDFGLAKVVATTTITKEHAILGTFCYMSPEQAIGDAVDGRSDIFSLGVVLYQMLTGRRPFDGEHAGAVIHAILYSEPMSILDIDSNMPQEVEQVVFKALQKKANDRYQSAFDFKADLMKLKDAVSGKVVDLIAADISPEEAFEKHRGIYSAMIGREQQIQQLQGYVTRMLQGKSSIVFISGEAGIGKSRLVWELGHLVKKQGVRYLTGQCVSSGGMPYHPIIASLRQYFDSKGINDANTLNQYINERAKRLKFRKDIVAAFLFRDSLKDINIINKEQLWDTVSEVIKAVAEDQPIILHVDDLHWADGQSIDMLTYVVRTTTENRVLIIGTYRPEDITDDKGPLRSMVKRIGKDNLSHEITLKRLARTETQDIISSVFEDSAFTDKFVDLVHRETEGNPLFVLEVLKLLKDEHIIIRYTNGWRLSSDVIEIQIPKTVSDVIYRRLEKLDQEERELIDLAAVEGLSFRSDTLAHCLEQPRVKILRCLQSLESSHSLIHATKHGYQFDHGKIKDVVYGNLIPELRKEYHRIVGKYLEERYGDKDEYAGSIALHFMATGKEKDAVPFLQIAAQHSYHLYANQDALDYVSQGINLLGSYSKQEDAECQSMALSMYHLRAALKIRLGSIQGYVKDHKARIKIARSIEDTKEVAISLAAIGNGATMLGNYQEAHNYNQRALSVLAKLPDKTVEAYILQTMAKTYLLQYEHAKAVNLCKKAYKIGKQEKHYPIIARSLMQMSSAYWYWADFDEAIKLSKQGLKLARKNNDMKYVAYTTNMIGAILLEMGEYRRALHYLRWSKRTLERIGDIVYLPNVLNNLGYFSHRVGDHERALSYYRDALTLTSESGDVWTNRMITVAVGLVYFDLAEYEQALHYLQLVCDEKTQAGVDIIYELNYICMIWLEIGAEKKALQTLQKIESVFSKKTTKFVKPHSILDDTNCLVRAGFKYYLRKDFNAAARYLYKALPTVKKSRRFNSLINTYLIIIRTEMARKNYRQVQKIANGFLSYAKRTGYKKCIAQGHLFLAHLFLLKKRYTEARKAAVQCRYLSKRYGIRELLWQAHHILGKISMEHRQYGKARKEFKTSLEVVDTIAAKLSDQLRRIYLKRQEIRDFTKYLKSLKKGKYS